jgi:hypothetical protein
LPKCDPGHFDMTPEKQFWRYKWPNFVRNTPIYTGVGLKVIFWSPFQFSIDKCKRYVHVPQGSKGLNKKIPENSRKFAKTAQKCLNWASKMLIFKKNKKLTSKFTKMTLTCSEGHPKCTLYVLWWILKYCLKSFVSIFFQK